MGWFFGCFGSSSSSRKKARHSHRRRHGSPISTPPPSSISLQTFRSKPACLEPQLSHSAPAARSDLDNVILRQVKKSVKDPWSQIDELEEELDDLRKKIEQDNYEAKKLKAEAISCKSPSQAPSSSGIEYRRNNNASVKGAQQSQIPSASPSLHRQQLQEWRPKAAADDGISVSASSTERAGLLLRKVLANENHFGSDDNRTGIATVLESHRHVVSSSSRSKQIMVSNGVTKHRSDGDNITTVNCTQSRILSTVSAAGYGGPDLEKERNKTSSSFPCPPKHHRYNSIDDTTSSVMYSLSLSDRNYEEEEEDEEDSGTVASSYSYCKDKVGIISNDNVKKEPYSAVNKVRAGRGRYDEALIEGDEEDPFGDAMGYNGGEAEMVEQEEGKLRNGYGEEEEESRHVAMEAEEAAYNNNGREIRRRRSKPASPVLTPVENVFQWKDLLKEREGKSGRTSSSTEKMMMMMKKKTETMVMRKDQEIRKPVVVVDDDDDDDNRVDVSLSEWGVNRRRSSNIRVSSTTIAIDASLSGWLPSATAAAASADIPAASSADIPSTSGASNSSLVGSWVAKSAASGTLPSRPDASFSHWAMPPKQDHILHPKASSPSPASNHHNHHSSITTISRASPSSTMCRAR